MQVTTSQAILGLLGSALSGSLPSVVINWFAKRRRHRVLAESGIDKAINEAVELALRSTTAEIRRLNERARDQDEEIAKLRGEIERLSKQHGDCEERAREQGEEIARLKAEIERQASEPSPLYEPKPLKHAGRRS